MGLVLSSNTSVIILSNQATIHISDNPFFNRTKNIEVIYHFNLDRILSTDIYTLIVKSIDQIIDMFIKILDHNW